MIETIQITIGVTVTDTTDWKGAALGSETITMMLPVAISYAAASHVGHLVERVTDHIVAEALKAESDAVKLAEEECDE